MDSVEKMRDFMVAEDMKETTQANYLFYAIDFANWLAKKGITLQKTTEAQINQYIAYKNECSIKNRKKTISTNTKNLMKASIRALLLANGLPELAAQVHGKKSDDKIPIEIPPESIFDMFQTAKTFYKKKEKQWKNERAYFLLSFLYQTGARIGEAVKTTKSDFDFDNHFVKVGSKGSEYIRKLDVLWLKSFGVWLEQRHIKKFVFANLNGNPLPKRSAQWLVEKIAFGALQKKFSAHKIRASCITHRLNAGEEFFSVSSNFHRNVQTTKRYMAASARSIEKMINPFEVLKKNRQ